MKRRSLIFLLVGSFLFVSSLPVLAQTTGRLAAGSPMPMVCRCLA